MRDSLHTVSFRNKKARGKQNMSFLFCKLINLKSLFSEFYVLSRSLSSLNLKTMKYLNVAEKNDAAKNIAQHLSRGTSRRREGLSKFNKIYEFEAEVMGVKCQMVMTSVSGHLLGLEFVGSYKNWQSCNPLALLDAPVFKYCPENYEKIKKTLEREVRGCQGLIIWTDCDREGENIGFEIIEVCKAVKSNLRIFRAKFSEITFVSVKRALENLEQPNKNISDAVDVRQELDLRIGAAFTRFQTLRLQKVFPRNLAEKLVSYGSCQFPTLGFVVERYRAVNSFIPEPFWKIRVNHTMNNLSVDFAWERVRLFDRIACQVLHDICIENPQARVCDVRTKPKSKWRPLPLDTVELEKLASRKLKINAKETMRLAERLYTQGFISYPRTETNEYPKEMNLPQLVEHQTADPSWGAFAQNILDTGGPTPRQGNKSDKAHPPIHPTKYTNNLSGNEKRLYEFIVRSFLACCSKDAQGQETTVSIDIANEKFSANGLMITARNYLEVYPYDKWSSKEIHIYENGQTFDPTSIDMLDGTTSPPKLLTEADLIALMEKHGIGTDATHAEHIETIKSRSYVQLTENIYFKPEPLGMGLVEGYDAMGLAISKPHLRAQLEADLKAISEGRKQPQQVLAEQVAKYKEVYEILSVEANKIDAALAERFSERPNEYVASADVVPNNMPTALKCPKCGYDMVVRRKKNNADEFYISCMSFPNCKNAIWLPPSIVKNVQVLSDTCPVCGPNYKKLLFEWKNNSISHLYPSPCTICIGGCDTSFLELLNINLSNVKRLSDNNRSQTQNTNNIRTQNNSNINGSRETSVAVLPARQNVRTTNPPQAGQFVPPATINRVPNANQPRNTGGNSMGNTGGNSMSNTGGNSMGNTGGNSMGNTGGNNMGNSDSNNIICNCNQPAILLTVRKQTANHGRKFYKCPASLGSGCDFFLWAPESAESTVTNPYDTPPTSSWSNSESNGSNSTRGWGITPTPGYSGNTSSDNDGDIRCNCGLPCKKVTVQKEGPNKGRLFYGCTKDMSARCNFFQWGDSETTSDWGSSSSTSNRGYRPGRGRSRGRGSTGTRNCGLCKQPGHTRNRCPNAND